MRVLIFFLACLCAYPGAADIYKWTDTDGKIHFSDQKPSAANSERVHPQINSYTQVTYQLAPAILPSKSGKAAKEVVMYSTAWCKYCKKARAYFAENNIPYTDYDIEHSDEAKSNYDAIGGRGVPIIFVGQSRMSGFSERGFDALYRR